MGSLQPLFTPPVDPRVARARRAAQKASAPYSRARHLDRILQQRKVQAVYQPIVTLDGRETVAFEALARGPAGTPLERPDLLFGTARDLGLVRELDWVCRVTAMEGALEAGFDSALTLFINVEPDVAATRAPEDLLVPLRKAQRNLRVVLEVTERAVLERPAELLHWLGDARRRWWGVALDDVGATSESLALLPFVRPDVVKLNAHFLWQDHTDEDRRVLAAVRNYIERTGATLLAEGIETADHVARAKEELGATLGQGWYFGRPGPLPGRTPRPRSVVPLLPSPERVKEESPWSIVAESTEAQSLPEAAVRRMFATVEQAAMLSHEAPVILASFPHGPGPWTTPDERLQRVRQHACFCGSVGVGLPLISEEGWQVGPLAHDEEMADEWVLLSIAPHQSAVVVAYDARETDETGHRLLEVISSEDRDVVSRVAELLMRKLATPTVDFEGRVGAGG